jgi:hypothetical protein
MHRRDFIQKAVLASGALLLPEYLLAYGNRKAWNSPLGKLVPVGRAMETEGYYVWCSAPIDGPDGKVHLFCSRWEAKKKMGGWIKGSEIIHAVADNAEAPFVYKETVLSPREGFWDATTCHNPLIRFVDGKYCLFYMGNSNGKTDTKRIGMATADSLDGPWERPGKPLLEAGTAGSWDDHCTTNPAFIKRDGRYWLYYKSWNTKEYEEATGPIRGNRKYGLAIAKQLEGPYVKYKNNPVIDFSGKGNNRQFEDAFIWEERHKLKIIARDMGIFNHENGLLMESANGIQWTEPVVAYSALTDYVSLPPAPAHLKKYGRLERPMLLIRNNKPAYLFGAAQGGKYETASTFIFRIEK